MDAAARMLRLANFKFRDIAFFVSGQVGLKRAKISELPPNHSKSHASIDSSQMFIRKLIDARDESM